jgi:hypothetical protein
MAATVRPKALREPQMIRAHQLPACGNKKIDDPMTTGPMVIAAASGMLPPVP